MRHLKLTVSLLGLVLLPAAPAASADVVYHFHWDYGWRAKSVSAPYGTHSR